MSMELHFHEIKAQAVTTWISFGSRIFKLPNSRASAKRLVYSNFCKKSIYGVWLSPRLTVGKSQSTAQLCT